MSEFNTDPEIYRSGRREYAPECGAMPGERYYLSVRWDGTDYTVWQVDVGADGRPWNETPVVSYRDRGQAVLFATADDKTQDDLLSGGGA